MDFTYTALNQSGGRITELLQAEDEDQAIRRLHEQGFTILTLEQRAATASRRGNPLNLNVTRHRVKPDAIVGLTRELAIMIETGVSIVDAFGLLAENAENPGVRRALVSVLQEISQGRTLTQAMAKQPRLFPKLYIAMISSAEVGGTLHSTLQQAADYLEAAQEMRRKVTSALTYPAVLVCAMVLVLIFMMVFLIPRFSALFTSMHVALPPTMQAMIALSSFVRHDWWAVPFIVVGSFIGLRAALKSPVGAKNIAKLILRVPILGDTVKKICIARILRALGTLLDSGVSLLVALDTIAQLAQNVIYEEAIVRMKAMVEGGSSLTDAAKSTNVFPAIVCHMTAVGEKSGRLTTVLLHISHYYEREIDARLKALASIIEPVMLVVLGIVVGFIAVSIFTPLYSIYDSIK
jgi:type IV pilus assembly protein PilC